MFKQNADKFKQIIKAFSQLGGMFNGLLAIGLLICKPLSQLELNRKLLNSIFNISQEDQVELEAEHEKKPKKNDKDSKNEQVLGAEDKRKKLSQSDNLQKSKDMLKSLKNSQNPKKKQNLNDDVKNFFKVQFSELQIKLRDYLYNYLSFFKRFQTNKQKLLNYGTNKLYNQIDIFYIINKMIEIEKIKHLILNENQIKLFEYLPRPQLKLQDVLLQVEEDQQEKDQKNPEQNSQNVSQMNMSNIQSPNPNQTGDTNNNRSTVKKKEQNTQFTLFSQESKTPLEKAQDAQRAFNQISKRQSGRSVIDDKLIRMLDPKLVSMFMENSFDFGNGDGDDDSQDIGKRGMEKSSVLLKKSIFQQNDATFKIDKTILEQQDEENRDIFNVSGIMTMNNQVPQDKVSDKEKNIFNSLVISQKIDKNSEQQSHNNLQLNEEQLKQVKQLIMMQVAGQSTTNREYIDSNNVSLYTTPITTFRQNNDNVQILNDQNNNNIDKIDQPIHNTEDDENGYDIKIREAKESKTSTAQKYFVEDSKDSENK